MLNNIILGDSLNKDSYKNIICKNFVIDPPFQYYKDLFKMPEYEKAIVFTAPNRIKDTINCCGVPDYILVWNCLSKNYIGKTRPLQQIKFALLFGDMKTFDNTKMRTSKKVKYEYERQPHSRELKKVNDPHIFLSDIFEYPICKCKDYEKPIEWCTILMKNFIDDSFIDLFAGNGTFLKVALNLNLESWHIDNDRTKCDKMREMLC